MSIQTEINEIMALAIEMCAREQANVFVHYSGHVNTVHVYAHPFDQLYQGEERTMLADKRIYLESPEEALEELKTLRQQIEQLAGPVPEVTEREDDLLAMAFELRNEMSLKGGLVVFYEGQATGWIRKLERPEGWAPGCIAIDEEGNRWVSYGGNDQDGATQWVKQ